MNSPTQGGELLYRELSKDSTCIRFSYPGFRSSIESNQHPKRPDDARIEELRTVLLGSCHTTVTPICVMFLSQCNVNFMGIPKSLSKKIEFY
ncbi:hypothetical protein DPX16_12290 [Anabarilius grahami]|uniref:Uncharacterized protein n=1 Tax=Anabarilius grahami TaxID=495550 RepID=A0A3N0XFK4_ANAGA|nr:hypothetical protein DPX16_12290 [Anabarilius grahami]